MRYLVALLLVACGDDIEKIDRPEPASPVVDAERCLKLCETYQFGRETYMDGKLCGYEGAPSTGFKQFCEANK